MVGRNPCPLQQQCRGESRITVNSLHRPRPWRRKTPERLTRVSSNLGRKIQSSPLCSVERKRGVSEGVGRRFDSGLRLKVFQLSTYDHTQVCLQVVGY